MEIWNEYVSLCATFRPYHTESTLCNPSEPFLHVPLSFSESKLESYRASIRFAIADKHSYHEIL